MKILVIGGTQLLGRHMVESLLAGGHTVTLFNRGRTRPHLFPEAERLIGDRDTGDLDALRGRQWDAAIDATAYVPRAVRQLADVIRDSVRQMVYISSASAYRAPLSPDADESAPLETMEDETSEEIMAHYGALKALCEREAERAYPGRVLNIRPGLVAGPYDHTFRVTYWVWRCGQGGEMLVAGRPSNAIQFIDGRDLAQFIRGGLERNLSGSFNLVGHSQSWADFIRQGQTISGGNARPVWIDDEDFLEASVPPDSNFSLAYPVYWPQSEGDFHRTSPQKALAAGLSLRPVEETLRGAIEWYNQRAPEDVFRPSGLKPDAEQEIIARWQIRQQPVMD
jgi:2'-hydroxyisoflavone reductase